MTTARYEIDISNFLRIKKARIPLGGRPVAVIGAERHRENVCRHGHGRHPWAATSTPSAWGKAKRPYLNDSLPIAARSCMRGVDGTEYRHWTLNDQKMMILDDQGATSGEVLGLTDFLKLSPKERVTTWEGCFLPSGRDTGRDGGGSKLASQIARKATVEEVLEMLKVKEWPEVEAIFGHKATEAKRTWERITGEKYGSVKAGRWNPLAWKSSSTT